MSHLAVWENHADSGVAEFWQAANEGKEDLFYLFI